MARRIRIAVMSGTRELRAKSTAIDTYRTMQDYWRQEFENVIYDKPEFIVLPEACDRVLDIDETQKQEYLNLRNQKTVDFFCGLAKEYKCGIVFNSTINKRNTSFAVADNGRITGKYDKVFPMTTEMYEGVIPGKEAVVFDYGKIKRAGFAICFDLNFNELLNEYSTLKPEVMFFSSMYHGGLVQKTWAYSTRSFFVSSICGRESAVTAPNGRVIARSTNYTDFCTADINLDSELIHLDFNREKFGDIKKKYGDGVIIDDIGHLGSALISCELREKSMNDIITEFELIRLDDYFDFARSERKKYL